MTFTQQRAKKVNRRPILIIEDDVDDQYFIIQTLKDAGVTNPLVQLNNGREVVDYLFPVLDAAKLPCLIILDLGLPDIRGLDLLKQLRENAITRPIPVIVMTHSQRSEDIINSYSVGANSYIRKTVNFEKFREEMNLFVSYWLEVCHLPA